MSGFLPVDVRGVVPMSAAVDAMAWAFEAVSLGLADMPTRIHMHPAGTDNTHIFMPVYLPDSPCGRYPAVITCKAVSIIPANRGTDLPVTIGMVMTIDPKTGAVTELFHGGALTAVRTGAAAGLATRLLANPAADVLAVIGAGGMAFDQVAAVCAVRNVRRVVISSRTRARAETLAERVRTELGVGIVDVIDDANIAVAQAQIVCTVTTSAEPVFAADAIKPGTHINASGAYLPHMTEIPLELIAKSGFYVDRLSSALHESGEVVQGIARGVFTAEHIRGELGGIASGLTPRRQSAEEVTIFKSAGMAVQDAAMVAAYLAASAKQP